MAVALGLIGCFGDTRTPPPPLITVEVLSDYEYKLDGTLMGRSELEQRLTVIADTHRRPITHNARAYMHIYSSAPGTGTEIHRLVSFCTHIGLDKIRVGR